MHSCGRGMPQMRLRSIAVLLRFYIFLQWSIYGFAKKKSSIRPLKVVWDFRKIFLVSNTKWILDKCCHIGCFVREMFGWWTFFSCQFTMCSSRFSYLTIFVLQRENNWFFWVALRTCFQQNHVYLLPCKWAKTNHVRHQSESRDFEN